MLPQDNDDQARNELAILIKQGGKVSAEDTSFHKAIIKDLCSTKSSVELILAGYLRFVNFN